MGPFAQCRLVDALGLAIGLGSIWFGADTTVIHVDVELQSTDCNRPARISSILATASLATPPTKTKGRACVVPSHMVNRSVSIRILLFSTRRPNRRFG